MKEGKFAHKKILVVGGAGFVGSNLVVQLLNESPKEIIVVDNLLSSEAGNVPSSDKVSFVCGSINEDSILREIPDDLDYAFHLACYHGNQSSIADPFADHENNTLTSLKIFERLSRLKKLTKVVYAAAGCAGGRKNF